MNSRCKDIFHLELIAYRFYKDVLNFEEEADLKLENDKSPFILSPYLNSNLIIGTLALGTLFNILNIELIELKCSLNILNN